MSPTHHKRTSKSDERLRLEVQTGDSQSEIIVLDSTGRYVERGLGPQRMFHLERGIYRIKVLTGSNYQEKSIVLTEERQRPLTFEPMEFASPVPLMGTSTSHEYHMAAAESESKKTHVADGMGSSFFFLVRDWTPQSRANTKKKITSNPATGLSLHEVKNGVDRKVADIAASSTNNLANDPWSACTVDVTPGIYELRLELPSREVLHQTFVASPGWHTQAFIFMRGYPAGHGDLGIGNMEWRADLSRTSVFQARQKGFSVSEPVLRVTELARVALDIKRPVEKTKSNRLLLSNEMRTILRQKFENPMLGIYAAHLLLLEAALDLSLFRKIVRHLRTLLGASHPDVEALALRADNNIVSTPFEDPPMLRRSWPLIVEASVDRPEVVSESLIEKMSNNFWREGPWHIWRTDAPDSQDSQSDGLSDLETALAESMGLMKQVRRARQDRRIRTPGGGLLKSKHPDIIASEGGQETSKVEAASAGMVAFGYDEAQALSNQKGILRSPLVQEIDSNRMREIARQLGVTQTQLQQVLGTLNSKLGQMSDDEYD